TIVHREILNSSDHGMGRENMSVLGVDAEQGPVPRSGHGQPSPTFPIERKALHACGDNQGFGYHAFVDLGPRERFWRNAPERTSGAIVRSDPERVPVAVRK